MSDIVAIRAIPTSSRSVDVTWTYTTPNFANYTKTLQFSYKDNINDESFEDIFTITTETSYTHTIDIVSKSSAVFYRMKLIHNTIGNTVMSNIAELAVAKPDCIALEIIRLNNLTLRKFVIDNYHIQKCSAQDAEENCMHYIQRESNNATPCPDCWDDVALMPTGDDCDTCGGSGYIEGGYYAGIPIFMQIRGEQLERHLVQEGIIEPKTLTGWTTNKTVLTPGDVIVERFNNKQYTIKNIVRKLEKRRYVYKQIVSLEDTNKKELENLS